jgi:hypothetical protein
MKEVIIEQDSKRLFLLLLGVILLTSSGFIMLNDESIFIKLFGAFSILIYSLSLVFLFKRLLKPKPILIINEKGFCDHSTAMALGFIPWNYVKHIYISLTGFVAVDVSHTEDLMENASKITVCLIKLNRAMGFRSIYIRPNSKKELANTMKIMNEFLEAYRNKIETL